MGSTYRDYGRRTWCSWPVGSGGRRARARAVRGEESTCRGSVYNKPGRGWGNTYRDYGKGTRYELAMTVNFVQLGPLARVEEERVRALWGEKKDSESVSTSERQDENQMPRETGTRHHGKQEHDRGEDPTHRGPT